MRKRGTVRRARISSCSPGTIRRFIPLRGLLPLAACALLLRPFPLAAADRIGVILAGGKSIATWHGQADLSVISFELAHPLSARTDVALAFAPVNLWQPRSWFGEQYGDGNENVRGLSFSILGRRRFNTDSSRLQWYLEGGTGPMWAEKRVPASTSRFNFMTQVGAGAVLLPHARFSWLVGYRFHHVSNGGYSPRNPGLNLSALVAGVQMTR